MLKAFIIDMSLKIADLRSQRHHLKANEIIKHIVMRLAAI